YECVGEGVKDEGVQEEAVKVEAVQEEVCRRRCAGGCTGAHQARSSPSPTCDGLWGRLTSHTAPALTTQHSHTFLEKASFQNTVSLRVGCVCVCVVVCVCVCVCVGRGSFRGDP